MTKTTEDTCDCSKCNTERILDFAAGLAERAPEDERAGIEMGDLICAINLRAIENNLSLHDMIRAIAQDHGELTKQLAHAARIAECEERESTKGYVQ